MSIFEFQLPKDFRLGDENLEDLIKIGKIDRLKCDVYKIVAKFLSDEFTDDVQIGSFSYHNNGSPSKGNSRVF